MSDPFPVVVYHNPACGTSRNVLATIEAAGLTPRAALRCATGIHPPNHWACSTRRWATRRSSPRWWSSPCS